MWNRNPRLRDEVDSKPSPTETDGRENFCYWNQNTPSGGSSETHPDQGSFQQQRNCTSSKLLARGVGTLYSTYGRL